MRKPARARLNLDSKLFPSRARRVRPTASRTLDAYCACERPIYAEFEWARACAFLHSSITYIFEYVPLYRTQRWFSIIYYNSSHAESRWGKDATKRTGDDDA